MGRSSNALYLRCLCKDSCADHTQSVKYAKFQQYAYCVMNMLTYLFKVLIQRNTILVNLVNELHDLHLNHRIPVVYVNHHNRRQKTSRQETCVRFKCLQFCPQVQNLRELKNAANISNDILEDVFSIDVHQSFNVERIRYYIEVDTNSVTQQCCK